MRSLAISTTTYTWFWSLKFWLKRSNMLHCNEVISRVVLKYFPVTCYVLLCFGVACPIFFWRQTLLILDQYSCFCFIEAKNYMFRLNSRRFYVVFYHVMNGYENTKLLYIAWVLNYLEPFYFILFTRICFYLYSGICCYISKYVTVYFFWKLYIYYQCICIIYSKTACIGSGLGWQFFFLNIFYTIIQVIINGEKTRFKVFA